jgi:hypothetical protein
VESTGESGDVTVTVTSGRLGKSAITLRAS